MSSFLCGCYYYTTWEGECKLTELDSFETVEESFIFLLDCFDLESYFAIQKAPDNLSTIKSQHNNHTNKVEQMSLGGIHNDIFESAERKKVLSFLSDEHVKRKTNFGEHVHTTSPPPP